MELKSLKCPNCGGMLDVEDGLDTFFCKYCGHKVIVADMSDAAYAAKTKSKEFEYKKAADEQKYKNQHDQWKRNEISKDNDQKREAKGYLMAFVPLAIIMVLFIGWSLFSKLSHVIKVNELKNIESKIEECIDDEDYDEALILANQLRLNDGYSHAESEEWDERREEYILLIRKAQIKDGDCEVIHAPIDSSDCGKYTKSEMVDLLMDAGFKNIESEKVSGSAGLFSKKNTVKYVTIDGIEEYSVADEFVDEAIVVIGYYEN